jgi:tetratricopeptide (TPR) repeat protein
VGGRENSGRLVALLGSAATRRSSARSRFGILHQYFTLKEALDLVRPTGNRVFIAVCAVSLGNAYLEFDRFAEAELFFQLGFTTAPDEDVIGRGRSLASLGLARYHRGLHSAPTEQIKLMEESRDFFLLALDLLPPDAIKDTAVTHINLANALTELKLFDSAFSHYQQGIEECEAGDYTLEAGWGRLNAADMLARAGNTNAALEFAQTAMKTLNSVDTGLAAEAEILITRLSSRQT